MDNIQIEEHDGLFLAYKPSIGALSVLNSLELMGFKLFTETENSKEKMIDLLCQLGATPNYAEERTNELYKRLVVEGWMRKSIPKRAPEVIQSVYFTLTRECDLACQYCYQGLRNRKKKEMPLEDAKATLDKIKKLNPNCHIIITGGEPFMHPNAFEILDYCESLGLSFGILCNGTYLDEPTVDKLCTYKYLKRTQISIDGFTEAVHSITRSKRNYDLVMKAIDLVSEKGLPFLLAPTIHEMNKDEIYDIAALAVSKGGWYSPNNLRTFPHDENTFLSLSNDSLLAVTKEVGQKMQANFSREVLLKAKMSVETPNVCSVDSPNSTYICGTGSTLLDIDWNGEVYPCHLLKDRNLILGNIFTQEFSDIYRTVEEKKIRVTSNDIEKCSGCKFTSTCGGGCRAGAFYAYDSLAREDDLCDVNYVSNLSSTLRSHPNFEKLNITALDV
ncbi:radical SAM/SPASM domain-containing protein [Aureispira anguillae]|uniref:Radical SAM protein n=1 Tax=Aureispira anguillae TaxID=2864201 RepID=A0A915YI10_9BACT|nr:radical SAM protein [Aureispira anguillae]BDS13558.1 radical SAM protein [Aureispira anguillae]